MQGKRKTEIDSEWPLMLRMSKVFADPQRVRILMACRQGETSPRRFCEEHRGEDVTLDRVTSDFDVLAQYDWIDPVEPQGASEPSKRLYRANDSSVFEQEDVAEMSGPMRSLVASRIFEGLVDRVKEAREAGTLARRPDEHLTWTPVLLDQVGWEKLTSKLDALFYTLDQERREAEARLAESGEEPIEMTVALLGFESPRKPAPES